MGLLRLAGLRISGRSFVDALDKRAKVRRHNPVSPMARSYIPRLQVFRRIPMGRYMYP